MRLKSIIILFTLLFFYSCQKDTDSDNQGAKSKSKTSASFEDAFQAELEAVHGDLGKSSSRRSGERKRR